MLPFVRLTRPPRNTSTRLRAVYSVKLGRADPGRAGRQECKPAQPPRKTFPLRDGAGDAYDSSPNPKGADDYSLLAQRSNPTGIAINHRCTSPNLPVRVIRVSRGSVNILL